MKTHTLTVRDRRLSWDDRRLTRDSVAVDEVLVDMDEEYRGCDTVVAVMVSAAHQDPVRMVVEGGAYSIPSELTRETGSILTCLIGYVGEVQRVTSEQESQPLVVTKSGPVGGTDPQDEQPDLWAQLIATVESAERIAQSVRDDADSGKFNGKDGKPGAPGTPGAPGDKGDPGAPGKDGISPSAKVEQTADGATVSITDKDGTTTATIRNGAKGDPGDKGDPGKDGTSPTASVNRTDTGVVITVTDANGTTSAEVMDGRDGETVIPDLGVTNVKIAENAVNTRTIADGSVTRAKLAQDALVKAGAGISIADDGTVGFNGNNGTFYFEDAGRVNILAKASANGTLNGTTYFSGVSTPTENSTGNVQWFIAGQVIVIAPREAVTLSVPAEWPTSAKLAFATLATGRKILKPIANARIARLVCDEGWFYLDADVATDGTVTLSLFVTPKQAGTAIHIKQTGFTQLVLPICGGGRSVT